MTITVYGIKNCNTVQKACKWLEGRNIVYEFHDYNKSGIDEKKLREFIDKFGWEKIVNRKGMTWRKLTKEEQNNINDVDSAITLMKDKASVIKRPIIDTGKEQLIGFDEHHYTQLKIS